MILDCTCGDKRMYHKLHRRFEEPGEIVFLDVRSGRQPKDKSLTRVCTIRPTVKASFGAIPFRDDAFSLTLFDPPHQRGGEKQLVTQIYGNLTGIVPQTMLVEAIREIERITKPGGVLLAKSNDLQYPFAEWMITTFRNFGFEALLREEITGSDKFPGQGRKSKTEWILFVKVRETPLMRRKPSERTIPQAPKP